MKRWGFLAIVFFYILGAILGLMGNAYTEVNSLETSINQNLVFLIILSVIIGATFFYFFKVFFPKGYAKQREFVKYLLPIMFLVLSFGLNRGWVQTLNTVGPKKHLFIDGYITSKNSETSGRTRFYYLLIADSISRSQYDFRVKKSIFDGIGNVGDRIKKEFLIGSFGIIYRANH